MKTTVDQCNTEVQDLLSSGMQQMLDAAAARARRRNKQFERPARPISAMPIPGGDISLSADIIEHRNRAVKVSNGTTEFWLPRSHVRRVSNCNVIISDWIASRKSLFLRFLPNQSPQYAEWLEKEQKRRDNPPPRYTGPGFYCKFDHM